MIKRPLIAIGLLCATATLACAQEAGKTDPATGKACVVFFASEPTDLGLLRMHFRNTCDSPFEIQIMGGTTRKGSIPAGTAKKPGKGVVTCRAGDGCETAKWKYE